MITAIPIYRNITRDYDSYDGDVIDALISAQSLIERETNRFFETGDRIETLKVHGNGLSYPHATPVTAVADQITTFTPAALCTGSWGTYTLNNRGWYPYGPATVSVAYTGGYGPEAMPPEIVRAVAELAHSYLKADTSQAPSGATALHVGDVSVALKVDIGIPSKVASVIKAWRRLEV